MSGDQGNAGATGAGSGITGNLRQQFVDQLVVASPN
jgi:hypothetical protein